MIILSLTLTIVLVSVMIQSFCIIRSSPTHHAASYFSLFLYTYTYIYIVAVKYLTLLAANERIFFHTDLNTVTRLHREDDTFHKAPLLFAPPSVELITRAS